MSIEILYYVHFIRWHAFKENFDRLVMRAQHSIRHTRTRSIAHGYNAIVYCRDSGAHVGDRYSELCIANESGHEHKWSVCVFSLIHHVVYVCVLKHYFGGLTDLPSCLILFGKYARRRKRAASFRTSKRERESNFMNREQVRIANAARTGW